MPSWSPLPLGFASPRRGTAAAEGDEERGTGMKLRQRASSQDPETGTPPFPSTCPVDDDLQSGECSAQGESCDHGDLVQTPGGDSIIVGAFAPGA